jgi:hypothetical protein
MLGARWHEVAYKSGWTGVRHLIRMETDESSDDAKFRFDSVNGVVLRIPDQHDQFSGQGPQGGATTTGKAERSRAPQNRLCSQARASAMATS